MRANLPIANTSATSQPKGGWFARLAVATSRISGRPTTFLLAVAIVLVWAITGPLFSDTWQPVINTGTTIVTFLMVFLIQATQNRDTLALQLKLDELESHWRHSLYPRTEQARRICCAHLSHSDKEKPLEEAAFPCNRLYVTTTRRLR